MLENIKELYKYREMLKNLVKKDLRTRYKGSILGFLWTFINPLLQLVVYTVVFSTIMRMNIDKYSMFLFVGLLPWIFFSNSVIVGTGSIIANKDLIKKIYFPREVIPISAVTSAFMNFIFSFAILLPSLVFFRINLNFTLIYLPLLLIIIYLLALSFALLFSAINVYFRDLEHILGITIMAWFYFTPIVFPVNMIPQKYMKILFLNPMTLIITQFREILYLGKAPDLLMMLINFIASILFLIFSYSIFKALQKKFAEEI